MTQIIAKEDTPVELEDLHIILAKRKLKLKTKITEETKKQQCELYELFKEFNPNYFEEAIPVKNALDKLYTSDIKFRSTFDFSRMY
ncbi:MAG: hypothetical protein ACFFA3_00225 [Promethearchaeota archaeon]